MPKEGTVEISIKELDKAQVLAALYNASRPLGMGFLQYDPQPMTVEQARVILERSTYFDYLQGRVMKVDLSSDSFDPRWYDRDNGQGAAQKAIDAMVAGDAATLTAMHADGARQAAESARQQMNVPHSVSKNNDWTILTVGLSDVTDELGAAIDAKVK
jgi:hypothetical protein